MTITKEQIAFQILRKGLDPKDWVIRTKEFVDVPSDEGIHCIYGSSYDNFASVSYSTGRVQPSSEHKVYAYSKSLGTSKHTRAIEPSYIRRLRVEHKEETVNYRGEPIEVTSFVEVTMSGAFGNCGFCTLYNMKSSLGNDVDTSVTSGILNAKLNSLVLEYIIGNGFSSLIALDGDGMYYTDGNTTPLINCRNTVVGVYKIARRVTKQFNKINKGYSKPVPILEKGKTTVNTRTDNLAVVVALHLEGRAEANISYS